WSTWPRMTILSCSAPAGGSEDGGTGLMGRSHIAVAPELLEGVFAFLVLRPAGALGRAVVAQLLDDFAHGAGLRLDGERAGVTADAAVAFSLVVREVEGDDGHALALDVFPDVQFGPVQ